MTKGARALLILFALAGCKTSAPEPRADARQPAITNASATPPRTPEPATTGVRCGTKICPAGEVCCNESCSVCAPPDAVCTMQVCDVAAAPDAKPAACATDADCRLVSDYCTGCDCRALGRGDKDPVCTGPGVRCVADPCLRKVARCERGACTAAAAPAR